VCVRARNFKSNIDRSVVLLFIRSSESLLFSIIIIPNIM